jgi:hypothetical protein
MIPVIAFKTKPLGKAGATPNVLATPVTTGLKLVIAVPTEYTFLNGV